MTRKDYRLIAAALKAARAEANNAHEFLANSIAARVLANALANDNPRFDRAKFLEAAGVETAVGSYQRSSAQVRYTDEHAPYSVLEGASTGFRGYMGSSE